MDVFGPKNQIHKIQIHATGMDVRLFSLISIKYAILANLPPAFSMTPEGIVCTDTIKRSS